MTILSHRQKLTFVNHTGQGDTNQVDVSPKPQIQTVPDWVRDTGTFQHAVKAGLVVEIGVVSQPAAVPEATVPEAAADSDSEDVAGLAAAGGPAGRRSKKVA